MVNLLRADAYKLGRSSAIKIILSLTCACAAVMAAFAYLIPLGKLDAGMAGVGFMFSDVSIVSILGAVAATVYICGDFEHKVFHQAIAGGGSRGRIIIVKAIVFSGVLALAVLPYALVAAILMATGAEFGMGSATIGYLHLLTSGAQLSAAGLGKLLLVLLTLMIVYIAQLSVCIPLSLWFKKPVLVVAVYYGFSILTGQLLGIGSQYPGFSRVFALTPYGGNHIFATLDTGLADIGKAIIVSLVFICAMAALAYTAFRKMELK